MRVRSVSWSAVRIPLRAQLVTAAGVIAHRESVLLRVVADDGRVGHGEAAPHPHAPPNAIDGILQALATMSPRLVGVQIEDLAGALPPETPSPVACAVDTAALDLLAQERGWPLARLLAESVRPEVPVNALLDAPDTDMLIRLATTACQYGFRTLKLKVAAAGLDEDRARLDAVRQAVGPDVRIRIDANGGWTFDAALAALRTLAPLDIEFVEQPLPPDDIDGMRRLRALVNIPIAADESVTDEAAARRLLEARVVDLLVLKPMTVGGLRPARRIIEAAQRAGVRAVVTTTIDAGVGIAAALHLAATLPSDAPAAGLATGSWLASDLLAHPLSTAGGRMRLPNAPGLGIVVDDRAVRDYTIARGSAP